MIFTLKDGSTVEYSVTVGDNCSIHQDTKVGNGTVIHNRVEVRANVEIGDNCKLDSGVTITGDAKLGDNVTLRNYVVVARGSEIGDNTFIAPQVMFNNLDPLGKKLGGAKIGKDCFIGTACVLQHGISICDGVTVGSMSFVNKDITEPGTYIGIPAKKVK